MKQSAPLEHLEVFAILADRLVRLGHRLAVGGDIAIVGRSDVALLVEKQMSAQFDKVIVVTAPQDVRIERLVGRGLTESDAHARIAAQATDAQRAAVADILVDNGADIAALRERAREVYRNLTA